MIKTTKEERMSQFDTIEETAAETNEGPKVYTFDDLEQLEDISYGEGVEIDEEADAFSSVAPPAPGVYPFNVSLGDRGIQEKKTPQGVKYHSVALEFVINSPENPTAHGATLYANLTTNIGRSKGTSTLATFLNKNGIKISGAVTSKSQLLGLKKLIQSEALTYIAVEWEASYKDEKGAYIKTRSKQKDFPKAQDGTYQFRFEKKLLNSEIKTYGARLYPVEYLGSSPMKKSSASSASGSSNGLANFSVKPGSIGEKSAEELEGEI